MSRSVHIDGNVAYMAGSQSVVYFSGTPASAGTYQGNPSGTSQTIKKLQNELNIAYWGEDNRFPQNVQQQMSNYGLGMAALNWKAEALMGAGIMPCTIDSYDDEGNEVVTLLARGGANKHIYKFIEGSAYQRFQIEYNLDLAWFENCFPEVILSKDGKTITGFVHQESCDARYQQMNDKGEFEFVFLSKLWGASGDQWAKFDPAKKMKGLQANEINVGSIDKKFISKLDCIDMYNPVESLTKIADKLNRGRKKNQLKSAIFPTNYPSINKTYYQVAAWDGARLAGWVEIAIKLPAMLKSMYNKAMRIKYHIEVPESFMERRFGKEVWKEMGAAQQTEKRKELTQEMDDYLTGAENSFTSFVSFFDIDVHETKEYGRVKITPIEDKSNIEKELITGSAADIQFLIAAGVNPTLFGAGTIGTGQQRSGGSDLRESFLIYNAMLKPKRTVMLEPLCLARDFNQWDDNIVFRVRDTVLTTLDTGTGSKKKVS